MGQDTTAIIVITEDGEIHFCVIPWPVKEIKFFTFKKNFLRQKMAYLMSCNNLNLNLDDPGVK